MTPFELPMKFTAWGFGDPQLNMLAKLKDQAKSGQLPTVAVQIGFATADHVKQLKDAGATVVAWNVMDAASWDKVKPLNVHGVIPQIEGTGQYDSCIQALKAPNRLDMSVAIVTTYAGIDDPTGAKWQELEKLGVKCAYVECYRDDDLVHADLDRMLWQGTRYGIPEDKLFALCGTYRKEMPTDYKGLEKVGRNYGIYLAEPMCLNPTQDTAWLTVNMPVNKVRYWRLTAGDILLHEERAITYPDKSTGYSKMIEWMRTHRDTVAAARSTDLDYVLDFPH